MALIAAHLNAGHSGGDSAVIGIYSPSSPTSFPPFSLSLISLMVSVDVKRHVYLLTLVRQKAGGGGGSCSLKTSSFCSSYRRIKQSLVRESEPGKQSLAFG